MSKKITDAQIALFVSGELSKDQMLQIQNAASKDPEIDAKIKSMQEFDTILKHDAENNYPIPDAFYKKVKDELNHSKEESSKNILFKKVRKYLGRRYSEISNIKIISTSAFGGALAASFCFVFLLPFIQSNNLSNLNNNQLSRGISDTEINFYARENHNEIIREALNLNQQNQRLSLINNFLLKQLDDNEEKWIIEEDTFAYKIDVKLPNGKIISYRPNVSVTINTEISIRFISFVDGILTQSDANTSKNIEISANQKQNLAYVVEPSESKFAIRFTWSDQNATRTKTINFKVNIKE